MVTHDREQGSLSKHMSEFRQVDAAIEGGPVVPAQTAEAADGQQAQLAHAGPAASPAPHRPANLPGMRDPGKSGKGKGNSVAKQEPSSGGPAKRAGDVLPDGEKAESDIEVPPEEPPEKLSQGAIDKRLRRIMTPRSSGDLKVPQEVVDQWKDKDERWKVRAAFEKAGYKPDP